MLQRIHRRRPLLATALGLALCAAALLSAAPIARAAVPGQVNYQGLLLDDQGVPVDGAVDITFALFDAPTAGTLLWSEAHTGVVVNEGVYEVALGSLTPIDAAFLSGGAVHLEITVDGDTLSPRQRLLAVPYAVRAAVAETAESATSVGGIPEDYVSQLYLHTNFDGGPPNDDPREGFADADGDGTLNFIDPDNDDDGIGDTAEAAQGSDINLTTPTISGFVPAFANAILSHTITVSGSSFDPTMLVTFGVDSPTPYAVTSSSFKVDVGPQPPGLGAVVVTLGNGQVAATTYDFSCPPSLTSISPSSASLGVATQFTVNGSNLLPGFALAVGPYPVTPTSSTASQIVFTLAIPAAGHYDLVIDYSNGCTDSLAQAVAVASPQRIVFVTSTTHNGALGGLAGADAICQTRATAAGLGGTYRAWLSDQTASPSSRFVQFGGFYTTNLETIATNWSGLTDGQLSHAIDRDEFNALVSSGTVWTGTQQNGTAYSGASCTNWTSADGGSSGRIGSTSEINAGWTNFASVPCNNLRRLYCVQE